MTRITGDWQRTLDLRKEQILPYWLAGLSSAEIAAKLGLDVGRVRTYIWLLKLAQEYPRLSPTATRRLQRHTLMRQMFYAGASNEEIAEATGYTVGSVKTMINQMGLVYVNGRRPYAGVPAMTKEEHALYKELVTSVPNARERYEIAKRSASK